MKHLNTLFVLSALILIASCGQSPVAFTEPQPADTKDLKQFSKRLQGQYVSADDSSLLIVEATLIQRVYDFHYKLHSNQIDTNFVFIDDTIINQQTSEKIPFVKDGDSLIIHQYGVDTIFKLSDKNVLRKSKGYCFLNYRIDESQWTVRKMELKKGELTISRISRKHELDNLVEIAENPEDTIPPAVFSINKKQFKHFVKKGGFTDKEVFIRSGHNRVDGNYSEITYRFGDSSLPPQYHRSYTITVTEEKIGVVVDSYGDILAEESFDLAAGKMGELLKLVTELQIENTIDTSTNQGCTGGTSRSIRVVEKGIEKVNGQIYICDGIHGTLKGNVDAFGKALRYLIPNFHKLIK